LLSLSAQRDVSRVKRSAQAKLTDVGRRIAELEKVRAALSKLITACPGHGRAADCPILQALSADEK
jgi:MerR family copper efflux transcriptional regulator